jgi:acyl-CoA thioesterase
MDLAKQIKVVNQTNVFMTYNGILVVHLEPGKAVLEATIGPNSRNSYGRPHGGLYFTMADSAAGTAARTDGRAYTTVSSSIEFVRAAKGGTLRAVGTVRHRGNSLCTVLTEVTDEEGHLIAEGLFTMFCLGDLPEHLK